ncbi:hypothetical protein ACRAKI_24465 [Saccharothrix isguenensis]
MRSSALGRPLPWPALQFAAVGVLVATASTIAARRGQRPSLGLAALSASVVFLPWAAYPGLHRI